MRVEGRGADYGVLHLRGQSFESLLNFLVRETRLTNAQILDLFRLGAVYVGGHRQFQPKTQIEPSTEIRIHTTPRRFPPVDLKSRVVFEGLDYLLLDKPSNLPVHALTDNVVENVISLLGLQLGRQVFITHRLDVETSGLLVIALTPEAQARLNSQIAERNIKRRYKASVEREITVGEYIHYMKPSPKAPKEVSVEEKIGWLKCRLKVTDCLLRGDLFQLSIELLTGRTQQIRAQLAALGAPIFGDTMYGGRPDDQEARAIALRACSIEIDDRRFEIL